ncbi:MAG: glycerol-3-phosphate acyltransferase [Candidatus Promineifilaceae bacterium]|nr:glycerol-3-phosphate acyltransferase [Candidatus Promineifilaceae bacterium]
MPAIFYLLLSGLIGYLFGSIPVGFLLVKATRQTDLRQVGSGRTGGTNSFRAAGLMVGVLTAVGDVLKAACGVWVVQALLGGVLSATWMPWAEVSAGIMSVVGHNWSVFIGFHGGAGTGPNVGWAGAIWFPVVPIAILVVLGVLVGLGIASIASLAMAAVIPLSFAVLYVAGVAPFDATLAYIVGSLIAATVVVWALRPNIRRLLAGEERIVGPRARRRARQQGEQEEQE